MSNETIKKTISQEYKYGFETNVEQDTFLPGLDEDVIKRLSEIKNEPKWLLNWRLKAYKHWLMMKEPIWSNIQYDPINYQDISYYSAPRKKFAESLEQQNRFNSVFKKYKNSFNLLEQYNRRIYHNKLECNYIRNDYEEETFHKNTGVYLEKQKLSRQHYHQVDAHYLNEINMRLCKICIKRV